MPRFKEHFQDGNVHYKSRNLHLQSARSLVICVFFFMTSIGYDKAQTMACYGAQHTAGGGEPSWLSMLTSVLFPANGNGITLDFHIKNIFLLLLGHPFVIECLNFANSLLAICTLHHNYALYKVKNLAAVCPRKVSALDQIPFRYVVKLMKHEREIMK